MTTRQKRRRQQQKRIVETEVINKALERMGWRTHEVREAPASEGIQR